MRKHLFRKSQRSWVPRPRTICVLLLIALPAGLVWYLTQLSSYIHPIHRPPSKSGERITVTNRRSTCVGWRQTLLCSPYGWVSSPQRSFWSSSHQHLQQRKGLSLHCNSVVSLSLAAVAPFNGGDLLIAAYCLVITWLLCIPYGALDVHHQRVECR